MQLLYGILQVVVSRANRRDTSRQDHPDLSKRRLVDGYFQQASHKSGYI
jgi:hypothetical protein